MKAIGKVGISAAALMLISAPVAAQNDMSVWKVIVRIGRDGADLDACGANGRVVGLNPNGDNFLAVRAGPGTDQPQIDRLTNGRDIWLCDERVDGTWYGVVYTPASRPDMDCNVGSPVESERAYGGPCRSGWVSAKYVQHIAG